MKRLLGDLWLISGREHTHPFDASSYLIPGDEPTLIDVGGTAGYPALKAALSDLGYKPSDIRRVIGTHGHWDHLAGMAALREESGAELWLHECDREQVETGDNELTSAFLYGYPFPPVTVDRYPQDGEVLSVNGCEIAVVHTPGHTAGCVCFTMDIEGQRLLIAGDTVWGGYHPRIRSDLSVWRESLEHILTLDFDVMTFGHWSSLILNAKPKVEKAAAGFAELFDPWFTLEGRGY
jgi:glyoxylase-like metal-dependent hydrolase (beta-lactamase superfamily II)